MRGFLYVLSAITVVALGFWAYQENYRTQAAIREVRNLHAQIGAAHARLNVLEAEWAYLNRPDRLRELADINFDRLGLLPMMPDSFGRTDQIAYPLPELLPITIPIDVSAPLPVNPDEEPL
jgi:hypothetical protein